MMWRLTLLSCGMSYTVGNTLGKNTVKLLKEDHCTLSHMSPQL